MNTTAEETAGTFPLIALRGMVVYPGLTAPLSIGRPASLAALQAALQTDSRVVFVAQRSPAVEEPSPHDMFGIGVVCRVTEARSNPTGTIKTIVAEAQWRCRVERYAQVSPHFVVDVRQLPDIDEPVPPDLMGKVALALETLLTEKKKAGEQTQLGQSHQGVEPDFAAMAIMGVKLEERQAFLEELSPVKRCHLALGLLVRELRVTRLAEQLRGTTSAEAQKAQQEKLLRERRAQIEKELADLGSGSDENDELRAQLDQAGLPPEARKEADREVARLRIIPRISPEYAIAESYLKWMAELPWSKSTEARIDLDKAKQVLDEDHYDREDVKQRILEQLAVEALRPGRGMLLCFVGPPGVGKTSFGRSIARATGRVFHRVSLGGVRDEAEIRGHRRTYIGALPGRIIRALRTVGVNNPVFMLDEVDKLREGLQGNPAAALLEVLDPQQNSEFVDHYLGVPFDLSRIMFIGTANTMDTIPTSLLDRLEVIEMAGYTDEEKTQIALRHLVPRQITQNGLTTEKIDITQDAVRALVDRFAREAGVRNLERHIASLCRKVAREMTEGGLGLRTINAADLENLLGPPPYYSLHAETQARAGLCTTLGMTPTGAELLHVEVSRVPGKGKLLVTGRVDDVTRESAQIVYSLVQASATRFGLTTEALRSSDYHLHFPRADISKEGTGTGLAIFVAFVSTLVGKPLPPDVAVVGEITLRGHVLETTQLAEKLSAAERAGIKRALVPERNRKDLSFGDKNKVPEGMSISYCARAEDAVRELLPDVLREPRPAAT